MLERCGTFTNESKEILEQTYEEKLQSIEIQHQSQLSKLTNQYDFHPHAFPVV